MYHNCANKGVDSVAPKVTSNTACRFFHATSSTGKVERGAPPTVSSRLLVSALENTSLPLPRSHRRTARDTGGLCLPHLQYVRHTLTTIIVLIKVARQWDSDSVAFGVPT